MNSSRKNPKKKNIQTLEYTQKNQKSNKIEHKNIQMKLIQKP